MRTMYTKKGSWRIFGIALTPSDSIYTSIREAIEENKLSQEYLQKVTGHLAPIIIDMDERSICFETL